MSERIGNVDGISQLSDTAMNQRLEIEDRRAIGASFIPREPPVQAVDIRDFVAFISAQGDIARFSLVYRLVKRSLDVVVSALALIVLLPILLVVAVAIRLDSPGPVFFIQDRVGYRGRVFRVLKFRTMVNGSTVQARGQQPHKSTYDSRITRVGQLLRKTSIDELPQLVNVLLGHMSIVGPRPEIVDIVLAKYQPWQYQRFLVPQGLTGWWQVTGRGGKLLYLHTEDDLHYIRNASLTFDLKIMLLTIPAVLRRDGAF